MGNIVWLASYPKSGNTWFRVFLANLLSEGDDPVDINRLGGLPIASGRAPFDMLTGLEAGDLTRTEIEALRPRVYESWEKSSDDVCFAKIHDAYRFTPSGEPVISASATWGAIYLVRNPLDVCVSYANHNHSDVDKILEVMHDGEHGLCYRFDRLTNQLPQPLSSWSDHVRSWLDQDDVPVHVVRYEDMKANPVETFLDAVRFAGLEPSAAEIEKALEASAFERLQKQESENGFREKPRKVASFFRRGEIGGWRDSLTADQVRSIISEHSQTMVRLGYLSEAGELLA